MDHRCNYTGICTDQRRYLQFSGIADNNPTSAVGNVCASPRAGARIPRRLRQRTLARLWGIPQTQLSQNPI